MSPQDEAAREELEAVEALQREGHEMITDVTVRKWLAAHHGTTHPEPAVPIPTGPFSKTELDEAVAEFRNKGILWPSVRELEAVMERNRETRRRHAEAEARKAAPETAQVEGPAVTIREATPPTARPKRGRGRPPKALALGIVEAARYFASGYTLRRALKRAGVTWLSDAERTNLYRAKKFGELVEMFKREDGNFRDRT